MAKHFPAELPPASSGSRIYEAFAPHDGTGAVYWIAPEMTVVQAVLMRRAGKDVVVCGDDKRENLRIAQEIETSVGTWSRDKPHKNVAGQLALPHFHQMTVDTSGNRFPPGHTFYEVDKSKAIRANL